VCEEKRRCCTQNVANNREQRSRNFYHIKAQWYSYSTIMSAKQEVRTLLERLPDNCSIEDIQYHLYVLEKVHRGLDDADRGNTISQEEAESRLGKWLTE
jgi:predicted transcriptional regulator